MVAAMVLVLIVVLILLFMYWVIWRDRLIRNRPFLSAWRAILEANLPIYSALPGEDQHRLQQLINLFMAKKRFVGCGGLQISDEIRITIAAQACLLLLRQGWSVYPKLYSVLVYPYGFKVKHEESQLDGTVSRTGKNLSGESWSNGKVILSWDDVTSGVADFTDGRNVVLHEFAHQLDTESGSANGAPLLRRNSYQTWAQVFTKNFKDLQWRSQHHHKTVMDEYGTTNPAEFFAVATETFFEKPQQLYRKRPKLYQQLSQYYQIDPRQWHQ